MTNPPPGSQGRSKVLKVLVMFNRRSILLFRSFRIQSRAREVSSSGSCGKNNNVIDEVRVCYGLFMFHGGFLWGISIQFLFHPFSSVLPEKEV